MIYKPQNTISKEGSFIFGEKIEVVANKALAADTVKDFWHSFCYNLSSMEVTPTHELIFKTPGATEPDLEGYAYAIRVDENGICVKGENEQGLLHGFITLLDRIVPKSDKVLKIDYCEIKERALIETRMVHYCVFPDTELYELEKYVRFFAALKYTHLVLEFWGMIKYDCMGELSWEHAYTKEQLRPIIRQAKELGMEIIPMFNHWAHAAASRIMHGKHVVLDRAPRLQHYFSDDGWCWDISKPHVRELFGKIRTELMELCGEGQYFHIGLDEPFGFRFTEENNRMLCDFINEVNRDVRACDRRTIVWGDMFVYNNPNFNPKSHYTANCPDEKTQKYLLDKLDKDILIGDWQYDCVEVPVESSIVFKEAGFDCLLCPWDRGAHKTDACINTVKSEKLFGVMHTTWHTLSWGTPHAARVALECWEPDAASRDYIELTAQTAEIMRKAYRVQGDYKKAGWAKYEIGVYVG